MKKLFLSTVLSFLALTLNAQKNVNGETSIQLIRNETIVLKYYGAKFLIDPLLLV